MMEKIIDKTTGICLLRVPEKEFLMGEENLDEWCAPVHRVRISKPYWLGQTPVTNDQYNRFLQETKHDEPLYWSYDSFNGDDQPVVGVSWKDAMKFCGWLSEKSRYRISLPTEAQWELAARGPESHRYPWGDEPEPDTVHAWFDETSNGTTHPVGRLPAGRGPYGHMDLSGNVWEWCLDVWNDEAYQSRKGKVNVDPCEKGGNDYLKDSRSMRGGCWGNQAQHLCAGGRAGRLASNTFQGVGFRVAAAPVSL